MTLPIDSILLIDPRDALRALEAELAAMQSSRTQRPSTLEPLVAIDTAKGCYANVDALRGELTARFGAAAAQHLDRIPLLASALLKIDADYRTASVPDDLTALSAEVVRRHAVLFALASTAALHGLVDSARLDGCKSTQSYRDQHQSLLGVESLLRPVWASLASRTTVTEADLDVAVALGTRFQAEVAVREHAPQRLSAAETRLALLTLLVEDWEELRAMVQFVREPHGDAEEIAPSFWAVQRAQAAKTPAAQAKGTEVTRAPAITPPAAPVVPPATDTPSTDPSVPLANDSAFEDA